MGALPISLPPRRKADLGCPEGQSPFGPSGAIETIKRSALVRGQNKTQERRRDGIKPT
ncbi:hypothetical protein ALP73_200027 [Pseudomonas coronafaciens pv. garcae]|nr:hypothetical protein ALP73_200027 [Pseudomonas coronafaciens pv. garcae]